MSEPGFSGETIRALTRSPALLRIQRKYNFSKTALAFRRASALIVSVPKSGRTWFRVLLHRYVSDLANIGFEFDDRALQRCGLPNFVATHDRWAHERTGSGWERIRGKHLVPDSLSRRKPIILLSRDPRDVVVSLYFHLTRRTMEFRGQLPDFIIHRRFGIVPIVDMMNYWLDRWAGRRNFLLVRYEDCLRDPGEAFGAILGFAGIPVHDDLLRGSIAFASFDNMRKMEAEGRFDSRVLQPADPSDPESYKVRRGKVGGFKDHLSDPEIELLNRALRSLDPRFTYTF